MSELQVREIYKDELEALLRLYTQLHNNPMPELDGRVRDIWESIHEDPNHHIIVGIINNRIVTSCVLLIVNNLTHGQRPYALVENVITDAEFRKRGYALEVLDFIRDMAQKHNCYKIMLMTGSKEEATLRFYERAGYNRNDKTAFIQWLK